LLGRPADRVPERPARPETGRYDRRVAVRASTVVRRGGAAVFRTGGTLTAAWRPLPDFLLIGAKRAGSTSLFYALAENPHVLPLFPSARHLPKRNDTKGVHYFDSNADRSLAWYRGHLPTTYARQRAERRLGGPVVSGEGSPYYLFHPLAPERAAAAVPEARLVVTLRDPIARTYSHWKEQTRNGVETLSFREALEAEAGRTAGEERRIVADPTYRSFAHENQSYAAQSDYAPMLRRWLEHFPREQLLVVVSEDFYATPQTVLDEVSDFLGIPRAVTTTATDVWNAAPGATLDPELVDQLAERFAPTCDYVQSLLGRPVPWTRPGVSR
jgi:hypothetical protein